ncbi:AAA family ATPase [Virgibacillus doumboii]|uniref:AAA family ATPase n=1 Tax=Virgibacillus doumboii TaxID=2697503 RepID=UPI0013E04B53|nr:AAA family ATPase [Virgibacillus doumboii]
MTDLQYWITGNTAEGFVNFLDTNLLGIDRVIALKHPSAKLKSKILQNLINKYRSDDLEILQSALGSKYLDGLINREKSVAFLDEKIANSSTKTIDLEDLLPVSQQDQEDFQSLTQKAHESFTTGLKVHDDLEEVYINQMDFDRADEFANEFISDLLNDVPEKKRKSHTYHRFFGTNTADGVVNVVPHLTSNIKHVHYIKGRAGTGKSTIMKKIAQACSDHGFDVELYHCSFDPNSIDMVLVRELDFCIFDSTDPHEFFPKRDGEVIEDLYGELVTPGTDEKFKTEINDLNNHYKSYMKQGIRYLKEADSYLEKTEQNYMENVTDQDIKKVTKHIVKNV